jgi:hypothetical protein
MESSTRTGELEPASIEPASFERASIEPGVFEPAGEPRPGDVSTTAVHPSTVAAIHEGCPVCGAAMAADQRYCVECGERRGAPRVPLVEGPAQLANESAGARHPGRRRSMSVNSTLIAGIGLLLLAMGIGVLIGRSGNNASVRSAPAQIVTVAGAGAAAPSTTATAPASSPSATPTSKSGSTHAAKTPKSTKKAPTTPLPKAVKVGTPGHGPGYKNGHFTGNFFGE